MSHDLRKPTFLFPTRSDTNRAVQRKKMDRALKFRIKKVEGFYYMYPYRVGVFVSLSKRHLLPKSTGNTQE